MADYSGAYSSGGGTPSTVPLDRLLEPEERDLGKRISDLSRVRTYDTEPVRILRKRLAELEQRRLRKMGEVTTARVGLERVMKGVAEVVAPVEELALAIEVLMKFDEMAKEAKIDDGDTTAEPPF